MVLDCRSVAGPFPSMRIAGALPAIRELRWSVRLLWRSVELADGHRPGEPSACVRLTEDMKSVSGWAEIHTSQRRETKPSALMLRNIMLTVLFSFDVLVTKFFV